jgi:hypothetical protein
MLLQKINHGAEKPRSGTGLKIAAYALSLFLAFLAGTRYERATQAVPDRVQPAANSSAPAETKADVPQPSDAATPSMAHESPKPAEPEMPLITPLTPSSTPSQMSAAASTPVRIEKAIPVYNTTVASNKPAPAPASASPAKQSAGVTILEPVQIPVKDAGRIVGYINLQKGQQITPVGIEKDQIKIKCGDSIVYVPVRSTDLSH